MSIMRNQISAQRNLATYADERRGPAIIAVPLVVLALFAPWTTACGSFLTAVLLSTQLLICTIGVVRSYELGARPVSLMFYVFMFSWLGIGPAYQLSHDQMAWGDFTILENQSLINRSLGIVILASAMFFIGSELQRRHKYNRDARLRYPEVEIRKNGKFVWYYLGACVLLAPLSIRASGGLGNMFASRSERSTALSTGGVSVEQSGGLQVALVTILPAALSVAAAVLAAVRMRQRRESNSVRSSDWAVLGIAFVLLVIFCNPLANTRFISILAFGSLVLVILQPRSVRAGRRFAVIAVIGTAVIYPLADIFRHGIDSLASLDTGTRAFASNDFDGFQQVANAVEFVQDQGSSFGHYTLSAMFYFVPRSVWSDKATPASIDVAGNRGYSFTNLSLPFPAEMYIEFGLVGMAVVLLLLGIFCSKADSAWQGGRVTRMSVLAPVMAVAMLGFVRGPLGSLAPVYITAILLVSCALTTSRANVEPRKLKTPM